MTMCDDSIVTYYMSILSVRPSVCLFGTLRHCAQTAKHVESVKTWEFPPTDRRVSFKFGITREFSLNLCLKSSLIQ